MVHRVHADQRCPAPPARACAGRPAAGLEALAPNFFTNSSATFWSTMMRSVDMQICPLLAKAAEGGGVHRVLDVGVVQDHQRRLAAQLQHRGLQVLRASLRDDAPHLGRAGEVDAPHRRVRHHRLDHGAGIGRRVGDVVDHARRKARILEGFDDQLVGARAVLAALQDHGVAARQRRGDRAHRQDDGRVPGRDAQHHAGRLANAHGQRARHVRGNHLAADLRGQRRRLADHAGGQHHVEAGPHAGGAGLGRHGFDELRHLGLQLVGGLEQQHAALAGAGLAPGLEGLGRGFHRHHGIGRRGGRRARGDGAVERIAALEGGVLFRRDLQAVDQHGQVGHGVLLRTRDHTTAWAWRWAQDERHVARPTPQWWCLLAAPR